MEKLLVLLVTVEQDNLIQALYNDHSWDLRNIGPQLSDVTKTEIYKLKYSTGNTENVQKDPPDIDKETLDQNLKVKCKDITSEDGATQKTKLKLSTEKHNTRTGLRSLSRKRLQQHEEKACDTRIIDCKVRGKSLKNVNLKQKNDINLKSNTIQVYRSVKKTTDNDESVEAINSHKRDKVDQKCSNSVSKSKHYCNKCPYSTNNKSNYVRHLREVHVTERHPCVKCNKTFKSKHEAKSHLHCAHGNRLQCNTCEKTFSSRGGLLNHTKQVHQKKVLYKCTICDATFFYRQHYLDHMNKHSATKPYSCIHCSKAFVYKCTWRIHEKSCKPNSGKEANTKPLKKFKSRVLCDICGEELSCKSVLITHHRLVHSDMPKSKCAECGKTFKGVHSLKRHVTIAHTEAKDASFPCEICGKSFNQVQVLREHVKRHKKEFSVYCQTCGKGFYTNFKLTEHERTHTGEKPFSCPICPRFKCSSKYNLNTHMKIHENGRQIKGKKRKIDKGVSSEEIKNGDNPKVVGQSQCQSQGQVQGHNPKILGQSQCQSQCQVQGHCTDMLPSAGENVMDSHHQSLDKYPGDSEGHFMTGSSYLIHSNHVPSDMNQHGLVGIHLPVNVQLDNGHYQSESGIHSNNVIGYEHRAHNEGYYGNTSAAVAQGLNILTVAMNMVDQTPY